MRIRLLLSTQASLLGNVTPNMRAISCEYDGDEIAVMIIFDGPASENDQEAMEEIASELWSHFPGCEVRMLSARVDAPACFADVGKKWWVYQRKET